MQPFQSASEELKRQGEVPIKVASKAIGSAAGVASAAAGGLALSRVMPLLSKYVPEDLAIKGLSKINPGFGKFINKALQAGESFDEIKSFITEKAEEGEGEKSSKDERNIIEKYSPELNSFMDQEVKKGRSPIEVGAIAQHDKRFQDVISKMSKDNKTNWSSIIESVFGNNSTPTEKKQGSGTERLLQLLQERKNK